jgi:serine/threonine protein kinase
MALAPGTRLGAYEILSAIGAGGMGEVYRARDTRLDRTVALKILPTQLAANPQFRERFEREARTVSQLTHPNICTLYDVGETGDGPAGAATHFLVMEHLEGETLSARLARGRLPVSDAVRIALEIASALDHAHRHGIIHRDLKPGNVMLTKSGAKLLDFGLAKEEAASAVRDVSGAAMSTMAAPLTAQGTILGTVPYMAPEQIEGRETDGRTDIFAFGVVLYQMLTARRPFEGQSPASVMSAILKDEARPLTHLLPLTPPALDHLVSTCLAKDAEERWQSASDLYRELKWVGESLSTASAEVVSRKMALWRRLVPLGATVAVALLAGLLVAAVARVLSRPATTSARRVSRLTITVSPGQELGYRETPLVASSPAGTHVAYTGTNGLYLRAIDEHENRLIATPPAGLPFFSPEGQWLGFFAQGKLKKVSISAGTIETSCDALGSAGATLGV